MCDEAHWSEPGGCLRLHGPHVQPSRRRLSGQRAKDSWTAMMVSGDGPPPSPGVPPGVCFVGKSPTEAKAAAGSAWGRGESAK